MMWAQFVLWRQLEQLYAEPDTDVPVLVTKQRSPRLPDCVREALKMLVEGWLSSSGSCSQNMTHCGSSTRIQSCEVCRPRRGTHSSG